jgi:cadmium resistance protein CadD (predicted permease)
MHAAVKVLIGFIMIAIGLGLFLNSIVDLPVVGKYIGKFWIDNFIVLLTGFIPPFLILIGLFVVWLEVDELKAEKELRMEEESSKSIAEEVKKPARKRTRKK